VATQVIAAGVLGRAATSEAVAAKTTDTKPWNVAMWIGGGLMLVGWTDVIMGMYPYRIGNPDWEFGAISAALDSMPLGTIGIGAASIGALISGRPWVLRAISVFSALVTVFLTGAAVLYALSLPVVLKAVPVPMHTQLNIAIAKALVLAATYGCLYLVMFRTTQRAASKARA
jgi:hypothetical protein